MLLQKVRRWALVSIAIFVSAQGLLLANPPTVQADGKNGSFISSELSGDVLDHQLYFYLYACFHLNDLDKITYDELKDWRWFEGRSSQVIRGGMYENTEVDCDEGQWLKEAFGRFGYTQPFKTYCALGFAYSRDTGGLGKTVNGGNSAESCESGEDNKSDFDAEGSKGDQIKAMDELLSKAPNYNKAKAPLSDAAEYVRYYRTFMRGCEVNLTQPYDGDDSDKSYMVRVVNQNGTTEDWLGVGNHDGGRNVPLVASRENAGYNGQFKTCDELGSGIKTYAAAYATYMQNEGADDADNDKGGGSSSGDIEPVCTAGALGWVFCPLVEAMDTATGAVAGWLEERLVFPPLLGSDQGSAIKSIWDVILNIANAGLVIVFLVIIFSQATSVGLSSYGVKKLLPRVVMIAVLMNLSFYLCAIAVDLANILGVAIRGIVQTGIDTLNSVAGTDVTGGASGGQWAAAVLVVIAAVVAAAATGFIFMLLPVLMTAMIAIFTAFLILAARDVIITLLIAISPLALLAWALPNTEDWFGKWRKLFTSMLMLFPIVMAIFYGSVLVANMILITGTGGSDNEVGFMTNLIALAVLTVPLFSLPFIMKSAGGVLDRLGVMVNNRNKGLVDRSRKLAAGAQKNSRFANAMEYRREDRGIRRAVRRGKPTAFNAAMSRVGGKGYGDYTRRKATSIEDKEFEQSVADAATLQKNFSSPTLDSIATTGYYNNAAGQRIKASEAEQVAAARWVMDKGNFSQRRALYESLGSDSSSHLRQSVSSMFYAKGDNAILGSSFGGRLLEGTSQGEAGIYKAAADQINAGKVTAQAMVHDADASELLATVSTGGYGVTAAGNESLRRAATESLTNETTRTKAVADTFRNPIERISGSPGITTSGIITPQNPAQNGPQNAPTQTQQQRSQGGNFSAGPGQNLPPAAPPQNTSSGNNPNDPQNP